MLGVRIHKLSDLFRVPDRGSVTPSSLGDGSGCMEKAFNIIPTRLLKEGFLLPPGEGQEEGYESRRSVC
jgi:hypothetical protein